SSAAHRRSMITWMTRLPPASVHSQIHLRYHGSCSCTLVTPSISLSPITTKAVFHSMLAMISLRIVLDLGCPRFETDTGAPSVGDPVAPREPDARPARRMRQELLKAGDAARPADDAQVQPDAHHARRRRAFLIKPIEGGAAVARKILGEN